MALGFIRFHTNVAPRSSRRHVNQLDSHGHSTQQAQFTTHKAEPWNASAYQSVGPLRNGGHLILTGNDNDYSVTQNANTSEQLDVYVDFGGNFARCVIDDPTRCEINPTAADLTIDNPVPLPEGFFLLPGLLHAYKASKADLGKYVEPFTHHQHEE